MTKGGEKQDLLAYDVAWGSVTAMQKIFFAKHLSVMLRSGLAISEALKLIHAGSQGHFRQIVAEIYTGVKSSRSLAETLSNYPKVFSGFFCGAVAAGEMSGNLAANLQNVAEQLQRDKELMDKVRAALFYPVLVMGAAVVIGLFVAIYILPKIVPVLSALRVELPWSTKLLIVIAQIIKVAGWQIVLGLTALLIALKALSKSHWAKPAFDAWWLKWPIMGVIMRQVNLTRWSRSLSVLLKSGVTITEALKLSAQALDNEAYRQMLLKVERAVAKGGQLAVNLQTMGSYFPQLAVKMIKVGEDSGKLQEALSETAEFYEAELAQSSKNLAAALEPTLLIVIGLMVGGLAIAIITPIYAISGGIVR
jgi:type II secretory pathway component PulF